MNSSKLDDVWTTRDYPMLVAIMKYVDTVGTPLQSYELEIDLDDEDQRRALRALQSQGLITASYRGDCGLCQVFWTVRSGFSSLLSRVG